MESEYIEGLELSKGEIEVYIILSKIGPSTVNQIAKNTYLYRSGVYEALKKLKQKNLVISVLRGKTQYFKIVNPKKLIELINEKQKNLEYKKSNIQKCISRGVFKKSEEIQEQEVLIYSGIQGMKSFLDLLVEKGKNKETIYAFGIPKEMRTLHGGYFKKFHKERLSKQIKLKLIFSYSAYKTNYKESKKLIETKYFPKDKSFPVEVVIFNEIIGIVIPSDNILVFVIKNKKIAKSFLSFFELLWEMARDCK